MCKRTGTMWGVVQIVAIIAVAGISSTEGVFQTMRAMTYNTGLISSVVPLKFQVTRKQRREKIIQDLKDSDASLVCLQELYYGEDLEAVVEGVKDKYQFSFSKIHNEDGTVDGSQGPPNVPVPVCDNPGAYFALSVCLNTSCHGVTDYTVLIGCAVQQCWSELYDVLTTSSQDCISCFVAAIPSIEEFFDTYSRTHDLAAVLAHVLNAIPDVAIRHNVKFMRYKRCANWQDFTNLRKINAPGLLMLSKIPLSETQYVDYHPDTVEAFHNAYLQAKVGRKVKNIQAVCTHMSVVNVPVYFEANLAVGYGFTSFVQQNLDEVNTLIQNFGDMDTVVVFGDMNVGPGIAGNTPAAEANYNALAAAFNTSIVPGCTICADPENPYGGDKNYIIDHVFARGFSFRNARRDFLTSESSLYDDGTQVPYSDHFAASVQLKRTKVTIWDLIR